MQWLSPPSKKVLGLSHRFPPLSKCMHKLSISVSLHVDGSMAEFIGVTGLDVAQFWGFFLKTGFDMIYLRLIFGNTIKLFSCLVQGKLWVINWLKLVCNSL